MIAYDVRVEASGYGQPEAEGLALIDALADAGGDLMGATVGVDEPKGMLLVSMRLDGASALDVQAEAAELWQSAWDAAFPEQPPPTRYAFTAEPAVVHAPLNGNAP